MSSARSGSRSRLGAGSKANFTPCGGLADIIGHKLEGLGLRKVGDKSADLAVAARYRMIESADKKYIKLTIFHINASGNKSITNYNIYCHIGTFRRGKGDDDIEPITTFLKDHVTDHSHLQGGRSKRRHKRRHSTRKN